MRKKAVFHPKEEFCVICDLRAYPIEQILFEGKVCHFYH